MSLSENLTTIKNSLTDINNSLAAKEVGETTKLSEVAGKVREIETYKEPIMMKYTEAQKKLIAMEGWNNVTSVIFTLDKTITSQNTIDFSYNNDNSVIGWINETTCYLSAKGQKIIPFHDYNWCRFFANYDGEFDNIEVIDVSGLDVSSFGDLGNFFYSCKKLRKIMGLDKWNTENLSNIDEMFMYCSQLEELSGIEKFDTSTVKYMRRTFAYCSNLQSLDLSNWNVSNVYDMSNIFANCSSLQTLYLNNWSPGKIGYAMYADALFYKCSKLKTIKARDWTTIIPLITGAKNVFRDCTSLSGFDSSKTYGDMCKPTSMGGYFTAP